MNPAALILLQTPLPDRGVANRPDPGILSPPPSGGFAAALDAAARATGLPPTLLAAVERQESGGNPNAVSSVGAIGLMQLMPGTAAGLHLNPWNPAENLLGGAMYLAGQLRRFGGNLPDAIAAYNAGPGAVEFYGGIPPYPETVRYVSNVMALYQAYGGVG
jgi:soluble lytic murein transglycosylase-like protein